MVQLDLRGWLEEVRRLGELQEMEGVHWDREMGAVTQLVHETRPENPPALLFDKIPGYPVGFRTLYGTLSSVPRLALTLGLPLEYENRLEFVGAFRDKMARVERISPVTVKEGPVLENFQEGTQVDVLKFPIPKHHEQDPARFIATASAVILRHPEEGWVNVGTYRSMVYDGRTIGLEMSPTSDGGRIQEAYFRQGKPMPVALCVGQHPLLYLVGASSWKIPELDAAGGLLGEPVEVIEGPYTGLPIPAAAEIVIEGVMEPGLTKPEGPFGEWMGYYASEVVERPYVQVKTVLHRNDPILTCAPQHRPTDETVLLRSVANAAKTWEALDGLGIRGVRGIWQHAGGAAKKFLVISLEQAYPGHARHVLHSAAVSGGAIFGGKWIIAVDEDIDPSNATEVIWALSTRVNGPDDFDFIPEAPSGGLIDPLTGGYFNTRILVDATIPFDLKKAGKFPRPVVVSKEMEDSLRRRWGDLLGFSERKYTREGR